MADTNYLYLQCKKLQKTFNKNLKIIQTRLSKDGIHDIRVNIKKLRACIALYNLINNETDWNYLLKKTNNLFEVLGKLRDIEICIELIKEYEKQKDGIYREFRTYLNTVEKIVKAWVNQEAHRYNENEIARIALLFKQDPLLTQKNEFADLLNGFMITLINSAKKSLAHPHKVRKNLKEIYYWIPMLPDKALQNLWNIEELSDILDDLGKWQDNDVLLIRIKHFKKDYLPGYFKEYAQITGLQQKIFEVQELTLRNAFIKLKKWYKKAPRATNKTSEV